MPQLLQTSQIWALLSQLACRELPGRPATPKAAVSTKGIANENLFILWCKKIVMKIVHAPKDCADADRVPEDLCSDTSRHPAALYQMPDKSHASLRLLNFASQELMSSKIACSANN